MSADQKRIDAVLDDVLEQTISFLTKLIASPSTRGNEGPVARMIQEQIITLCDSVEVMTIPDSFRDDPGYSWPQDDFTYTDSHNLRLRVNGTGTGRSLVFNTHMDVVPPSDDQVNPFTPKIDNGILFGRGACDAKGQIALIYGLLLLMNKLGLKPHGNLITDLVVEEENGGNGSYYMLQHPAQADAAIIFEPTGMKICAATRGAVWFDLHCKGRAGHSGSQGTVVSALKVAIKAMGIIEGYHDDLLAQSRAVNPLFDEFANPMPVTFGQAMAGDWPATVPSTASVKGVFGFLPSSDCPTVQNALTQILRDNDDTWLAENSTITFDMLNNDGCELDPQHPLVTTLAAALDREGVTPEITALTAACDSWRYSNQLGIPSVVFGIGQLRHAHSNIEQVPIADIRKGIEVLFHFVNDWCGLS